MFPASFGYVAAHSVDEALVLLEKHGDEGKLLAGGHSLIPAMKLRFRECYRRYASTKSRHHRWQRRSCRPRGGLSGGSNRVERLVGRTIVNRQPEPWRGRILHRFLHDSDGGK